MTEPMQHLLQQTEKSLSIWDYWFSRNGAMGRIVKKTGIHVFIKIKLNFFYHKQDSLVLITTTARVFAEMPV